MASVAIAESLQFSSTAIRLISSAQPSLRWATCNRQPQLRPTARPPTASALPTCAGNAQRPLTYNSTGCAAALKKSILPVLAEGNQKHCQSLHQSLPSRSPPTDKVCIPSTCEFANLLSTQYSSARVCSFNVFSGHYPLLSHRVSAPSAMSHPRLHDAHSPRAIP